MYNASLKHRMSYIILKPDERSYPNIVYVIGTPSTASPGCARPPPVVTPAPIKVETTTYDSGTGWKPEEESTTSRPSWEYPTEATTTTTNRPPQVIAV